MTASQTRFARTSAILAIVLAALGALPQRAEAASLSDVLRARIVAALRGSTSSRPAVAVQVDGLSAINYRGWEARRPASTVKLYSGLTALLALGPDTRLTTQVRRNGLVVAGVLKGSLELVGGGDPMLSTAGLQSLANSVARAGITRIEGRLWANDLRYDRSRSAPGWRDFYIPDEIGPLSALAVGGNRWRKDGTYLRDPVRGNIGLFRKYLAQKGVTIAYESRIGAMTGTPTVVSVRRSPPISDIVRYVEKHSYNFGAEMLLKEIGRTVATPGARANGLKIVKRWASKFKTTTGTMVDGSGLSVDDRLRPWDEIAWLNAANTTEFAVMFRHSLPLSCEHESTLRGRMCGTAAARRVFAKTGNLLRTISLSGYTKTTKGRAVRFAFMLPGCTDRDACRKAIDRAVVKIVEFGG